MFREMAKGGQSFSRRSRYLVHPLFGLDHHKISYRFHGPDFRLTGVNSVKSVKGVIAWFML